MDSWLITIGIVSVLVAGGNFLDEHHIDGSVKSKARDFLVRCFFWLECHQVPSFGHRMLARIAAVIKKRQTGLFLGVFLFAPVGAIHVFYFGRMLFGPHYHGSYTQYLLDWLNAAGSFIWLYFLVLVALSGVCTFAACAYFNQKASLSLSSMATIGFLLLGTVAPFVIAMLATALIMLLCGGGGYLAPVILAAVLLFAVPAIVMEVATFMCIFFVGLLNVLRWLLMNICDSATKPTTSPFLYASSLGGLLVLIAKTFMETIK